MQIRPVIVLVEDQPEFGAALEMCAANKRLVVNWDYFWFLAAEGDHFAKLLNTLVSKGPIELTIFLDHQLSKGDGRVFFEALLAAMPEGSVIREVICTSSLNGYPQEGFSQRSYIIDLLDKYPHFKAAELNIVTIDKRLLMKSISERVELISPGWRIEGERLPVNPKELPDD